MGFMVSGVGASGVKGLRCRGLDVGSRATV